MEYEDCLLFAINEYLTKTGKSFVNDSITQAELDMFKHAAELYAQEKEDKLLDALVYKE